MKIYGHPMSTCTRKVLMTAKEKKLAYEFVLVDFAKGEHKAPAHVARQPFGQLPAFEDDDGFALYESRAICRYLDAKSGENPLLPTDPKGRALVEQWISVEASNFTPPTMKIVLDAYFHSKDGTAAPEIVKTHRPAVEHCADVMEKALEKNEFIAGGRFTLADISFMPYVEYLIGAKQGDVVSSRPKLAAWWSRISARPTWKAVIGG